MFSSEAETKFFHRVEVRPEDSGCWRWVGPVVPSGYGMFRPVPGPKKVYAHRWSQERWNGPIPDGWQVDHLCKRAWCVNPEHLEAVTPRENVRRAWNWTQDESGDWFCQRGHNLGRIESGGCRECEEDARRQWRSERRERGIRETYVKSPEQKERDRVNDRRRDRRRFMDKHPELTDLEVDRHGTHTIAQRYRRGWIFDGAHWYKSDGTPVDDLPAGS